MNKITTFVRAYLHRIRDARQAVRAVEADMLAESERRWQAGEPYVEDDHYERLNERAEQADTRLRAAWRGRDLPTDQPATTAPPAAPPAVTDTHTDQDITATIRPPLGIAIPNDEYAENELEHWLQAWDLWHAIAVDNVEGAAAAAALIERWEAAGAAERDAMAASGDQPGDEHYTWAAQADQYAAHVAEAEHQITNLRIQLGLDSEGRPIRAGGAVVAGDDTYTELGHGDTAASDADGSDEPVRLPWLHMREHHPDGALEHPTPRHHRPGAVTDPSGAAVDPHDAPVQAAPDDAARGGVVDHYHDIHPAGGVGDSDPAPRPPREVDRVVTGIDDLLTDSPPDTPPEAPPAPRAGQLGEAHARDVLARADELNNHFDSCQVDSQRCVICAAEVDSSRESFWRDQVPAAETVVEQAASAAMLDPPNPAAAPGIASSSPPPPARAATGPIPSAAKAPSPARNASPAPLGFGFVTSTGSAHGGDEVRNAVRSAQDAVSQLRTERGETERAERDRAQHTSQRADGSHTVGTEQRGHAGPGHSLGGAR